LIRTPHGECSSWAKLGEFYSLHMVNNGETLSKMREIRGHQYRNRMGDTDGEKNWNEFAICITDKGKDDFW